MLLLHHKRLDTSTPDGHYIGWTHIHDIVGDDDTEDGWSAAFDAFISSPACPSIVLHEVRDVYARHKGIAHTWHYDPGAHSSSSDAGTSVSDDEMDVEEAAYVQAHTLPADGFGNDPDHEAPYDLGSPVDWVVAPDVVDALGIQSPYSLVDGHLALQAIIEDRRRDGVRSTLGAVCDGASGILPDYTTARPLQQAALALVLDHIARWQSDPLHTPTLRLLITGTAGV
jgi:hypothetical protein